MRTLPGVLLWLTATAAHAEVAPDRDVVVDADPAVTCRAAHAVGAPGCPRLARRTAAGIELFEPVRFEIDKWQLRRESFAMLDEVAALLAAHPTGTLEIQGHYRSTGYAVSLSQRRAATVRDYLIARGVPAARLIARGYGEDVPLVPPISDPRNRRIELRWAP
ncbi:MAG: OmpA family protein [Myxococcales bacterium]|nr:OmpA family protein [Myxococcales bacterium]MBP6843266.1 OmpA family protein [Kofleriaceae bacterium]